MKIPEIRRSEGILSFLPGCFCPTVEEPTEKVFVQALQR
jgi:hypothetical protein